MTDFLIPLTSEDPAFSQKTTLDDVTYVFDFNWNERESRWYMSLSDESNTPIVSGVKLIPNIPLLRRVHDPRRPPGELSLIDPSGVGEPPGRDQLGQSFFLHYYDDVSEIV